jgi:hypothetical protein
MAEEIHPRNEPEVMRAKAHRYVAKTNRQITEPYEDLHMAMELAEQAYKAHGLPYEEGLSKLFKYPPTRFTWLCDETGDAKHSVKLRDNQTNRVVTWPHWHG